MIRYATTAQWAEITRLLAHPTISAGERTRMLLSLPSLDEDRAEVALTKLAAAIAARGGLGPGAELPARTNPP